MKIFLKIVLLFTFFFISENELFAQINLDANSPQKKSENAIKTANDLKSGNWQDVLSSFFQLSVSNLTGANKSLNFNSTLFALKVKTDSTLLIDKNYLKEQFARNFQFNLSLKLDSNYKFKGFSGGFTWALINKRDSTVFSLAETLTDSLYLVAQDELQSAFVKFRQSLSDSTGNIIPQNLDLFVRVRKSIDMVVVKNGFAETQFMPAEFQPFLQKKYDDNVKKANLLFEQKLVDLRKKPLLTLSANSTFKNDQQNFNNGEAQLVYLQGISSKKSNTEIDFRSYVNIGDTLLAVKQHRSIFKTSLGINFSLFQGKSFRSVFEFKPYFEYQSILTNPIADEKKNQFTANAELRIRVTDNIWLPITLKYDLNKKNLLGFLNVAFNLNAFKNQKS